MKKYIKIVFWCALAFVLCLSYEWISNIIFDKINYLDVKFGIIPDVLLPSINAVVDTFISLALIVIYLILAIFIVKRHDERVKIGLFKGII